MDDKFMKAYAAMIKQHLSKKLYADIGVWIENETLYVTIIRSNDYINWKYSISNISMEICKGLSTEYAAYRVEKAYRNYLTKVYVDWRFFKKEETELA